MEFINKNKSAHFYPSYILFEGRAWNDDPQELRYIGYDYESLKSELRPLFIEEQNSLCCYCMASLEFSSSTLEHIFPQKPNQDDSVENYGIACIFRAPDFNNTKSLPNEQLTNLPHDISYYNLVASCDSKVSCNNKRGNKQIKAFFFQSDIKNEFEYDDEGNIFSQTYESEIKTLGLAHPHLVNYRKLWKLIKLNQTVKDDLKSQILEQALILGLNDDFFLDFINNNGKVRTAMRFGYFLSN